MFYKKILFNCLIGSALILPLITQGAVVYQSAAYGVGEQQNLAFSSSTLNAPLFPPAVGESFTLNTAANITDVDFYIDGSDINQTIQLIFRQLTDNPSVDGPIFSQTFNFLQYTRTENVIIGSRGNTDNVNFILNNPLSLDAGSYAVFITNTQNTNLAVSRFGPTPNCSGSDCNFTSFGSTQVQINANNQSITTTGYASGMRLNGEALPVVSAVPLPAATWLFASALPLLFGFTKRKSR